MPDIDLMGAVYPDVPAVDLPKNGGGTARFYDPNEILYAASPTSGGSATYANAIHYGAIDGTSTSTKFTASIPGITEYYDGLTVMLYNGVVTSAANYTVDINDLGAYGTYSNMAMGNPVTPTNPTRDTTIFNINYAMLLTFCSHIGGGNTAGWICYRGYDANTNTIGYQIRTNSFSLPMTSIVYRYRLLFQSADNAHWVPATNSSSTNATAARTVCQDHINPFGEVVYYGTTSSVAAGSRPSASNLWEQYGLTFGYSFQTTPNYELTAWKPVYLKCTPQSDGSAVIDSDVPFVQDLPTSEDGKIYKLLGYAYSTTAMELVYYHPVYWYKNGMIRQYTTAESGIASETDPVFTASAAYGITSQDITNWNNKVDAAGAAASAPVQSVNGSTGAVTISVPTNVSDLNNDSGFVDSAGAAAAAPVASVNGQTGTVTIAVPTKTSDLENDSNFMSGMTILSYGHSTWQEVLAAYNAKHVVYCRASSGTNPASGAQTRMAFMAYVNAEPPTNIEFQYYRSVNAHSASQQGDQMYVYKIESNGTWSVTVRESYTKIVAGTGLTSSYSNGVLTISLA